MSRFNRKSTIYSAPPRVNLLPDAQNAEQNHQRALPKLLLILVSSAVVAGMIALAGYVPLTLEQGKLADAEAESARLTSEIAQYAETQATISTVNDLSAERQRLTADEVLFMPLFDQIRGLKPESAILEFMSLARGDSTAGAATSPVGGGVCTPNAASVHVTLGTGTRATVLGYAAELTSGVSALPGFVCAEVTEVTSELRTDGEVSSTVFHAKVLYVFDETVQAHRFDGGEN